MLFSVARNLEYIMETKEAKAGQIRCLHGARYVCGKPDLVILKFLQVLEHVLDHLWAYVLLHLHVADNGLVR